MKTLKVRNVIFNEGIVKTCVPLCVKDLKQLSKAIKQLQDVKYDVVEFRLDYLLDLSQALEMISLIRKSIGDHLLLTTFRSKSQGGEQIISEQTYNEINQMMINSGLVDMIDVEFLSDALMIKELIKQAHQNKVVVILSHHDFKTTPAIEVIEAQITQMKKIYEADIVKVAYMPSNKKDVINLMQATYNMHYQQQDLMIISMSMGELGKISRVLQELFGSVMSFGSNQKASAPGQLDINELNNLLALVHQINKNE